MSFGVLLAVAADSIYLFFVAGRTKELWLDPDWELIYELLAWAAVPIALTTMALVNQFVSISRKRVMLRVSLGGYALYCLAAILLIPRNQASVIVLAAALFFFLVIGAPVVLLAYRSYTKPANRWWQYFIHVGVTIIGIALLCGVLFYLLD